MQLRIQPKWSLLIICIVGIFFSSIIILFSLFHFSAPVFSTKRDAVAVIQPASIQVSQNLNADRQTNSVQTKEQEKVKLFLRLKIPKIKVNSFLESVGLTSTGAIDVPKGPTNAAWFNLGPRPGEKGSAIITGHFGVWKNGTPTVFNNLYKLQKGDKLYIQDEKGVVITFVVRELITYGENENPLDVFNSNDDQAHLNLITCQGIWNKTQKSFSERLVVFTDKE
ncbi:MAG: class F sortase [Candidatus Magasanikbacteria bacterium]|nr:class F sortase [Candidatus Magasanikbacteria bacterium]